MQELQIGNRKIGQYDDCYVIAEAGSNHMQKIKYAFELIEVAASSEADAVKFQLFKANTLYSKFIDKETYQGTERVQLPLEWIPELLDKCKSNGITFLATPFDKQSIEYLDKIDIAAIKWASGDLNSLSLLSHAAKFSRPMIIATGMATLGDVELAIETVKNEKNTKIALLHCISDYPTQFVDANLRMMDTLSEAFDYPVGFSDHTMGISISLAAVARGAKIIEKHFTLDKDIDSSDHPFSIHPHELKLLVKSIHEITSSLGSKHKHIVESEKKFALSGKRSIVVNRSVVRGTRITEEMISLKRPGTGIPPQFLPLVLGRTFNKDVAEDEVLTWTHLS